MGVYFLFPLEFRKAQNLLNIARGIGMPLKIDRLTLDWYQGMFARVYVDVDLSKSLPERILVTLKNIEKSVA